MIGAFRLDAACVSKIGRIRKNNEDNFYFDGQFLENDVSETDQPLLAYDRKIKGLLFGLFDGMGGEDYGEEASAAAAKLCLTIRRKPLEKPLDFLNASAQEMNRVVVAREEQLGTSRMGCTMNLLYFTSHSAFFANLGDSRSYLLRDGKLQQLSVDHVDSHFASRSGKAPLTQYLGVDPELLVLEPSNTEVRLKRGDRILLCSDGITDMLSDYEITEILNRNQSVRRAVKKLSDAAIIKGGRDNLTSILVKIY